MMELVKEILEHRSLRAVKPEPIPRADIELMIQAAHMAPSCFNYQPWRFVSIDDQSMLSRIHALLGASNRWMTRTPVLIAVTSHRDLDCRSSDGRDYFTFDCGLAVGFLMVQAQRMGYISHPVAGYKPVPIKALLKIPEHYQLITLINIARHSSDFSLLDNEQKQQETGPRIRKPLTEVLCWNEFQFAWTPPR